MTDWSEVLRPQLLDLGPYVPGPSLDDLKRKVGIQDVAKLNWNEGLFGPLPGVLDAVARELPEAWSYPEHAYLELREGLAAETGAGPDQILPAHGIQTLILTLCSAFLTPGDRVVVPQPTYGLYAQASRAAGATVERVPSPELRLDLERIADAARRTGARLAWICDPNNPTGSAVGEAEWRSFLDALPPGCVVAADEAYADYIEPGAAHPARGRRGRRPPGGGAAHVLEDLRPRRAAARLRAGRRGPRALPAGRAGALQREPPGARGGRRRASAARRTWTSAAAPPPPPATTWRPDCAPPASSRSRRRRTSCSWSTVRTTTPSPTACSAAACWCARGASSACPAGRGSRWARGRSWTVSSKRCPRS